MSVYLIAGGLYQRFVLGAKGVEQIPNYEFWKDFGNLQAVSTFRFCHFSSFQISLAGSCWCFHCNTINFFLICVHYFQNMILRHVIQGCPRIWLGGYTHRPIVNMCETGWGVCKNLTCWLYSYEYIYTHFEHMRQGEGCASVWLVGYTCRPIVNKDKGVHQFDFLVILVDPLWTCGRQDEGCASIYLVGYTCRPIVNTCKTGWGVHQSDLLVILVDPLWTHVRQGCASIWFVGYSCRPIVNMCKTGVRINLTCWLYLYCVL